MMRFHLALAVYQWMCTLFLFLIHLEVALVCTTGYLKWFACVLFLHSKFCMNFFFLVCLLPMQFSLIDLTMLGDYEIIGCVQ
jgi:hypothetical protein